MSGLQRASVTEITALYGAGEAKAVTLKAAIESPEHRPTVNSPADAAALV